MSRIYKTKENLQTVWNHLDNADEHLEKALEMLCEMSLSGELFDMVENFDLSEIRLMKNLVEELQEERNVKF